MFFMTIQNVKVPPETLISNYSNWLHCILIPNSQSLAFIYKSIALGFVWVSVFW